MALRILALIVCCAPSIASEAQAPLVVTTGPPTAAIDKTDPLFPQGEPGMVGQLHTITLITSDVQASLTFYQDAWAMRAQGPFAPWPEELPRYQKLWGMPVGAKWRTWVLDRPAAPGAVQIRLIALDQKTPPIRSNWTAAEAGPLSIGFAVPDVPARYAAMTAQGVQATGTVQAVPLKTSTGAPYTVNAGLFKAPDHVLTLAVGRRGAMAQVGPVDPATGIGGPSYSGQVVGDSGRVVAFYRDVLGFQVRRDMELSSAGENGGLGLPHRTSFRFLQMFAPGSWTGYLVFLDLREKTKPAAAPPRPPQRGIAMWTFAVRDLAAVERRLKDASIQVVGGPVEHTTKELGRHRVLTALAPNGFLLEFAQPLSAASPATLRKK